MGLRGPQPGPPKILCSIRLTPEAKAFLDEKASKAGKGDRGGMSYLARNVEEQAKAAIRSAVKREKTADASS